MALDIWILAIHILIALVVSAVAWLLLMDLRNEKGSKAGHLYAMIIIILVGAFLAYFILSIIAIALIYAF